MEEIDCQVAFMFSYKANALGIWMTGFMHKCVTTAANKAGHGHQCPAVVSLNEACLLTSVQGSYCTTAEILRAHRNSAASR